ncbi:mobilome CxxCx(11)CxxC protein [Dendrosporobacter sp. 1207_IL3150]|uniref:mobilome CxxCx(11)CxxC protein n=1 Tax=Dendrosporobacter sp. 1207_IL3150 TaxID=3084054 RepID=UPI002FDAFA2D
MSPETIDKLNQFKLDAMNAKTLYLAKIKEWNFYQKVYYVITLIIPIMFFFALYWAKGQPYENSIGLISLFLSIFTACYSVWSLINNNDQKSIDYHLGLENNTRVVQDVDYFLSKGITTDEMNLFSQRVDSVNNQDSILLASISKGKIQKVYVANLKQLDRNAKCPVCNTALWNAKRGWFFQKRCEACRCKLGS